jgi:hypothetical protein
VRGAGVAFTATPRVLTACDAITLQPVVRHLRLPAFSTHAHAVRRTVAAGVDGPCSLARLSNAQQTPLTVRGAREYPIAHTHG